MRVRLYSKEEFHTSQGRRAKLKFYEEGVTRNNAVKLFMMPEEAERYEIGKYYDLNLTLSENQKLQYKTDM